MPVKKDASGRRMVEAEVEVPGTPEEVWQAIATGPGISSWFVPCEMEGREGGDMKMKFAPDDSMDARATITDWDPPHRYSADSDDMGPGAPTVASEWTVEARSGGTCVVRVVHSWFSDTDDWDDQFEGTEQGWRSFFEILRQYLTHFSGESCVPFQVVGAVSGSPQDAWRNLTDGLGLAAGGRGQRAAVGADAPPLAGVVERSGSDEHPELLVRLDSPSPGLAHLFPIDLGGATYLFARFYLYGDRGAEAAAGAEATWQAWMNRHAPTPAEESSPAAH